MITTLYTFMYLAVKDIHAEPSNGRQTPYLLPHHAIHITQYTIRFTNRRPFAAALGFLAVPSDSLRFLRIPATHSPGSYVCA